MLPHRIVAFGASSVHGIGDPLGGGFVGQLKSWHESQHPLNMVFNLGIPGDTTSGMVKRFTPEVAIRTPELILFYPGLNDIRRTGSIVAKPETSLDQFESNIRDLISQSRSLATMVVISSFPPDESRTLPYKEDRYYRLEDAAELTGRLCSVCKTQNVPYYPLFENSVCSEKYKELSTDGIHSNSVGHQQLLEDLLQFLETKPCSFLF